MPESEVTLVQRARTGSRAAFAQHVSRYADGIYGCVLRTVGDAETARDVAQDAFLRAFASLHKLRDPARFKSWLYSIAVNRSRDWLRRQRHEPVPFGRFRAGALVSEDDLPSQDTSASPSRHAEEGERDTLVAQALASLPLKYREVMILRFQEDFRVSEIAEALGISESATSSRLRRGREMLRPKLEGLM